MSRRRVRVRLDPTRCTAFGYCAEFFPEAFALDDWGYAWLHSPDLPLDLEPLARETARLCPTGAIRVEIVEEDDSSAGGRQHPRLEGLAGRARAVRPRRLLREE